MKDLKDSKDPNDVLTVIVGNGSKQEWTSSDETVKFCDVFKSGLRYLVTYSTTPTTPLT